MRIKKIWVVEEEYFYTPHPTIPGIYELYWVDKNGVEHCIQNFCIEENALMLSKEDRLWRLSGYNISNITSVFRDLKWWDNQVRKIKKWPQKSKEEKELERKKRQSEARKRRRLERKSSSTG